MFTISMQQLFKRLDWEVIGVVIKEKYRGTLWFRDDIVFFGDNGDKYQQMIEL